MDKEEERELQDEGRGPQILECEVREAVKELTNNNALGVDVVPGEFLKTLGEEGTKVIALHPTVAYFFEEVSAISKPRVGIPFNIKHNQVEGQVATISLPKAMLRTIAWTMDCISQSIGK